MKALSKNLELKKHVATIHSASRMTLLQRKIANGLLYNAYHELLEKDEFQISTRELCELIGYNSNDHKIIKNALLNLLSTVVEWNLLESDDLNSNYSWNASSMIADASIRGSICTYSYSKRMKELLYRPEMYGRLNMAVLAKFKSTYGLVLYENCIRYQNLPQTSWFELATFRQLMGVGEGEYLIFRDLKRRVIDKAVKEVNLYAPIYIVPEYKKLNRAVTAIRFLISASAKHLPESLSTTATDLEDKLLQYGLTKQQVEVVRHTYSERYILEKITLIESSSSFKKGKIDKLASYLISALENDYQPPVSSKQWTAKANPQAQAYKKDPPESINKELLVQYENYLNKALIKLFETLDMSQKQVLSAAFEKSIKNTVAEVFYQKEGLANPIIQDYFRYFVTQHYPDLLTRLPKLEEYAKHKGELA